MSKIINLFKKKKEKEKEELDKKVIPLHPDGYNEEEEKFSFEETMERNRKKKERLQKQRNADNSKVKRSYRLKPKDKK